MPDEHPPAAPSAPRGAEALTLRQADQARTDFAAIESNLEFIMSQLSGVPTRKQLASYSLVVMVGTGPRLSGSILVDKAHGIGTTRFGTFGDGPDTRGQCHAAQNSVFHQLLKHMPWPDFERLVAAHGSDAGVRRLTTKSQFLALLYGQLAGAASLREIVGGMQSHRARLYHLGARLVKRSTLADANRDRASGLFTDLLALMIARAHRGLRRRLAETTYLVDATALKLDSRSLDWARFSEGVCGAKLHVVYDPDADRPIYAAITPARVNDITAAQAMPLEPGAPAQQIADLYKRRWAIELFFRWVKQSLKIRRFLGTSENAVRIQIAVALIAFLLLRLAQAGQNAVAGALAFARLVRLNLMHRKPLDRLLDPEPPIYSNPDQMAIQWNRS